METRMLLVILTIYLVNPVRAGFHHVSTNYGEVTPTPILFSPGNVKQEELVFAYLGIPYAEPPIEERRFYPPKPVQPWEGALNTTTYPPPCPQVVGPRYELSEDCLYLNVYVPETVAPKATVMVYIHGGSFTSGSSTYHPVNPLAALGDVIVVTLNYRLNIFGFFTTGDDPDGIPPNLGLLDQRLALQWVYENIEAFGGDPEKITLVGQSAGAASVGFHLLVEDSRRYFRRVILQSGVPLNPWAQLLSPEQVRELTVVAGNIGGCGNEVGPCLRSKSAEELLRVYEKIEESNPSSFRPSFDGKFFPRDIPGLLQNGSYRDIDVLLGTTENEGTFVTLQVTGAPIERPFVTNDEFSFLLETSDNPLVTDLVTAIYSGDIDESNNYEGALSSANGDIWFTCGVTNFARQVADAGSKVYAYRMTQVPATSVWNREWLGATHDEDIQFVFGFPFLGEEPTSNDRYLDAKVSFYMIQMWTNFAKSGNPNTPRAFPRGIPEWPQFLPDTEIYKELDIDFSNGQQLRRHYCNFWENLVPQIFYLSEAAETGSSGSSSG